MRKVADIFLFLCFTCMLIAMLVQVMSRYLLNIAVTGTEEIGVFAQCWMALVGAGVAVRMRAHVAVEIFVQALPLRIAQLLSIALAIGALAFLAVVFWGSLKLMEIGKIQTSPALGIPMWTMYLALPIGSIYFAAEILISVIDNWNRPLISNEYQEV
jgi:C4-dicarboxylate transporter DctQ subunit